MPVLKYENSVETRCACLINTHEFINKKRRPQDVSTLSTSFSAKPTETRCACLINTHEFINKKRQPI